MANYQPVFPPVNVPPGSLGPGPRRTRTLANDLSDAARMFRDILAKTAFCGLAEAKRDERRRRLRAAVLAVEEVRDLLDCERLVLNSEPL